MDPFLQKIVFWIDMGLWQATFRGGIFVVPNALIAGHGSERGSID